MCGEAIERFGERPIVPETRCAFDEPSIKSASNRRHFRTELSLKSRWIADQVTGVDFEEPGEKLPRRVREVGPCAVFDQGKVRLADAFIQLGLDGADNFYLRELAVEPAQMTLEVTQHAKLLAEFHSD